MICGQHVLLFVFVWQEYLQHCPSEPIEPTDPPNSIIRKAIAPLELLIQWVPGSIEALLLMARTKFIGGDVEAAQHNVSTILRLDNTYGEAHLLAAQIAYYNENLPQV